MGSAVENALDSVVKDVETQIKGLSGKLPLHQIWTIVQTAIANVVLAIEQNVGSALSGPAKKQLAMTSINNIIKVAVGSINIPYVPTWLQSQADTYVESFLSEVASGSIDSLVSTFQTTGVFPATPTTVVPPSGGKS